MKPKYQLLQSTTKGIARFTRQSRIVATGRGHYSSLFFGCTQLRIIFLGVSETIPAFPNPGWKHDLARIFQDFPTLIRLIPYLSNICQHFFPDFTPLVTLGSPGSREHNTPGLRSGSTQNLTNTVWGCHHRVGCYGYFLIWTYHYCCHYCYYCHHCCDCCVYIYIVIIIVIIVIIVVIIVIVYNICT